MTERREHELNRRIHHAIALGTIAAAERDALQAVNDALTADNLRMGAERDALQALVNDLAAWWYDGGNTSDERYDDLLARLDAAAKE